MIFVAQETVAALGHTPGAEATCTTNQTCTVCNIEFVAALGHTEATDAAVAPTCTETGLTEGKHCAVCEEVLLAQETVEALGHSYSVTSYPATCIEKGYDEFKCDACEHTEIHFWEEKTCTISLDYLGYEMIRDVDIYAFTIEITGGGSQYYDANAVVVIYDIYGSSISQIYPPTYISYDGTWQFSQTVYLNANWYHTISVNIDTTTGQGFSCNYDVYYGTYTYTYDSLHKYQNEVTAPTKTEEGYTTHTCSVCGDSYVDSYTDAIGSAGLSYEVNEDGTTCTIIGMGSCEDEDVYIPTYIDGYQVTAIGEKAFDNLANVKNIYISKTIRTIADKAFYKCTGLTEIMIPANVTSIGKQIFLGCDNLATLYYDSSYAPAEGETFVKNTGLKKIVFGDNLTTIPSYICYNCDNLEEIILSENTEYIGYYAFYYCTSVKQITLPDGLIDTGWYAFYGMNITEIIIPDSVETIYNSFRDCKKLERIVFPVSVITVPNQTFIYCSSIKEVYYTGDELEWSAINISADSAPYINQATVYYYTSSQPAESGNYWHYVDGVPTKW
jgi:hypothetical protein